MRHISSELAHLIARQHGVVHRCDLIADGLDRSHIARLVASDRLVVVHRGVYRVTTSPDTFESRCAAACFADRTAAVSGLAAARLWGFRHTPRTDVPDLLVPHHSNPMSNGVRLRRTNVLSDEDVVRRPDGIRVTSPPRAWFDVAVDLDDDRFEMLTEHLVGNHAQIPTLWRTLRRLEAPGRRGLARVRRVLSRRPTWQKPAGSGLELRVLAALRDAGLPELVRQHPIRLGNGTTIHPDGAVPDLRWAVEVDHVTWHGGRFDAQYDKSRDRAARRVGWQVERVTDQALHDGFASEISSVAAMYRLRVAEFRTRTA